MSLSTLTPRIQTKLLRWAKDISHRDEIPSSATSAYEPSRRASIKDNNKRRSLLSFRRPSKQKAKPLKPATEILPTELWTRILRYALRLTGAQAVDLKDPFQSDELQEDYPNIHPGYFEDRSACRRVCRVFDSIATNLMMEYVVVHTEAELEWTVKVLEADTLITDPEHKRLGDWTTRIDFRISGKYDPEWALRLLALTPNLLVFTMNTGYRAEYPEHSMNKTILQGLIDFHSKNLKRLDWAGMNDAPTYADLYLLSKNIRGLTTLHLRHLYTLPSREVSQPMIVFPSLKSLSLGLIPLNPPPGFEEDQYPFRWEPFLMYLMGRPFQLSKLERFDIDLCPVADFFTMHGHKIRTFRTTSWSDQESMDDAFARLVNLETFLFVHHAAPECHIPLQHPTLKRIAVIPRIEEYVEVPQIKYQSCIIKPLDNLLANIEDMDAKKLTEVRVCDRGAFTGVFETDDCLFWHWRRRFQTYKNIALQNKFGDLNTRYAKYGKNPPKDPFYPIQTERPAPQTSNTETTNQSSATAQVSHNPVSPAPASSNTSTSAQPQPQV